MARWKQHFESLLNIHDVTNHTPIAAEQTQVADSITGSININIKSGGFRPPSEHIYIMMMEG